VKHTKCVMCPFLEAGTDGQMCSRQNKPVKKLVEGDIRFCMSSHYEACSVYIRELYKGLAYRNSY